MKNTAFHPPHAEDKYCDCCIPGLPEQDKAELIIFEDSFRYLLKPYCECVYGCTDRCREARAYRDSVEQTVNEAHEMRLTWASVTSILYLVFVRDEYMERQLTLNDVLPPFRGKTYEPAKDEARLKTQLERVRALCLDGRWRTLHEIAEAVHGSEAGVSARLRDLRRQRFGGFLVERRRVSGGLHEYKVSDWMVNHD
jgi:hypothetical protein